MMNLKQKIIVIITVIGLILIYIFAHGLYSSTPLSSTSTTPITNNSTEPQIIATDPSPLEEAVILPTQSIKIVFNYPILGPLELKTKIDPPINYHIKLSDDRKTVEFIPIPNFNLGAGYTLFILPNSKFEDNKILNSQIMYHFRTINYRGD